MSELFMPEHFQLLQSLETKSTTRPILSTGRPTPR